MSTTDNLNPPADQVWSSLVKVSHFLCSQVHSTTTDPPKIIVDFKSVWYPGLNLRPLNHSPAQTSHPSRCWPLPVSLKFATSLHAHTENMGLASNWQPDVLVPQSRGLSLSNSWHTDLLLYLLLSLTWSWLMGHTGSEKVVHSYRNQI